MTTTPQSTPEPASAEARSTVLERLGTLEPQGQWLRDLLDPTTGLNVSAIRFWGASRQLAEARVLDFVAVLNALGYETEVRPLGPRRGARIVIVPSCETDAPMASD